MRSLLSVGPPLSKVPSKPLVLVLGANMGAGHQQVGRELARRLAGFGVAAKLVDMGDLLPPGWGRALTGFYKFMA